MIPYARFNTQADSEHLISLLEKNNIKYELTHEVNQLDNVYLGDALDQLYVVSIPRERFAILNNALTEEARTDFSQPEFTHYFDSFDENELLEVINSPNDWNVYDSEIARLMLEKMKNTSPAIRTSLDYTLSYRPDKLALPALILSYLVSFSPIGMIIGSFTMKSKKTLQNGATVFIYDEPTRKHGLIIFILGVAGTFLLISRLIIQRAT